MSEFKLITNKIAPQKMFFRGAIFLISLYNICGGLFLMNFVSLKYPQRTV